MFRRRRSQLDFSTEIEAHIALEADRLRSEGMSEAEAQGAARRAFGNQLQAREDFYNNGRRLWWDHLRRDLFYSIRILRRSPTFTAAAIVTLALGIGANTALFTVINAVLLRPLPYPDSKEIVMLYGRSPDGSPESLSPADFLDYRRQSKSFEQLAGFREISFNITGGMQPQRVAGAVVTPNFFETLKVPAEIGRAFSPFDKIGIPLAVLSYSLWQKQYGGDPSVIGKPIEIDGELRTVVGIMPAGFQFPIDCEAWTLSRFAVPEQPLAPTVDQSNARDAHYFDTLGRLSRGVTIAQVQAETDVIARRLKRQYANDEEAVGSTVISLHDDLVGKTKSALLVLLGGVTLLLLISCVNVANILLARGSSRQKEIAIRSALGAGRLRIVRQLLTESLLLAVGGGIAGALLAWLVWIPLRTSIPPEMLSGFVPTIDWRVLTFTGALSLASGLIFGMFPALQTATSDLNNVLKEGGRGSMIGARAHRTQSFLVIVEIAFATVLLISAGLLIRSFVHLVNVNTGVNPENVLTVELSLSSAHFPTTESRSRFVSVSLDRIRAIPGVVAAGITSRLPLNRGNSTRDMDIKGRSTAPSEDMNVDYLVVSPDYFRTLSIPLIQGRNFTSRDTGVAGTPEVIINETAARRFWPKANSLNTSVTVGHCASSAGQWCQVVGVVADVRQHDLSKASAAAVYVPYNQDPWPFMTFVVRTRMDPVAAVADVRSAFHSVDKDQPLFHIRTMQDVFSKSLSARRFNMLLLGSFAFLAIALGAIGIYGVMAYSVTQRSIEIGIRVALGAEPRDVLSLVLGSGLKRAAVGISMGLAGSFGAAKLLANSLYGMEGTDLITFGGASVMLAGVALLASYIPARRATQIDPSQALREQ